MRSNRYPSIIRVAAAFYLVLGQLIQTSPARGEPETCAEAGISFAPFEPKEFSWWNGSLQYSALLIDGKQSAKLVLTYDDSKQFVDDHKPNKYISVVGTRIGLWTVGDNKDLFYQFEGGSPNGYIIPARYDGKSAASTLRMPTKDFLNVTVDFDYPHPMPFSDMMLHIVCFLKSDFVKGELK